jgi:hypothetical protein
MNKDSPGVKILNSAGIAINKENIGINIHVLFKKKPILILEKYARTKQTTYRQKEIAMLFVKSIAIINNKNVITLILGSKDCKNPFLDAYSSEKIDSLKNDITPVIERSTKLFFDTCTFLS